MTKSTITRERIELIANFHRAMTLPPSHDEIEELARMALAAMDSEPVRNPVLAYADSYRDMAKQGFESVPIWSVITDLERNIAPLYRHAQPVPRVPENCVTAEHRRVIEMLLSVCGAAFELADDSCQQDVDGEDCHVVPDDAFQKLSDALDEIENTLPTEVIDRPDVFLAWSAIPKAALKSLLQAGNSPVTGIDLASGPDRTVEVRYVAPPGYVMVPMRLTAENGAKGALSGEFSETKFVNCPECFGDDECETCDGSGRIEITVPVTWTTIKEIWAKGVEHFAAAPQSPGSEPATVPGKWIPVSEHLPKEKGVYQVWNGKYVDNVPFWFGSFQSLHSELITHWMPLPAAPQETNS